MQLFVFILSLSLVYGAVTPVKRSAQAEEGYGGNGYSSGPKCHDKKNRQCHKIPKQQSKQECFEEYDVIEDTVYYEECEDIIETYCEDGYKEDASKKVHTTTVLGHDSKLVGHGGEDGNGFNYGKREAERYGYSDYSQPQCHNKKDRKCHKVPLTNKRKVPKPICKEIVDTIYIEECEDIVTSHCEEYHENVEYSSHGHDSYEHDSHGHDSYEHDSHGHESYEHDSNGYDSHGDKSYVHSSYGHGSNDGYSY